MGKVGSIIIQVRIQLLIAGDYTTLDPANFHYLLLFCVRSCFIVQQKCLFSKVELMVESHHLVFTVQLSISVFLVISRSNYPATRWVGATSHKRQAGRITVADSVSCW